MFGPTSLFQFRWLNIVYVVCWLVISFWLFLGAYRYDQQEEFYMDASPSDYALSEDPPITHVVDLSPSAHPPSPSPSAHPPSPSPSPSPHPPSPSPSPSPSPIPSSTSSPLPSPSSSQAPTFPPVAAPIYANRFEVYPPNDPLYPDRSVSDHHPYLRHLLNHWIHFSDALGFRYVAIAGTLLGALRNGHIIPWDSDMDVAVDRETGEKITRLAAGHPESGVSRSVFDGLSIEFNSAVIDHQPWADGEVRLIVNRYLALDLPGGNGPHFNRTGHLVPDQEDSVSFTALFARLVSWVDGRYAHLDIFCTEEFEGKYGWESIEVGPSKASFPKQVEPCAFEGRMIWCPSKGDYDPIMQNNYGSDYMVPRPPS